MTRKKIEYAELNRTAEFRGRNMTTEDIVDTIIKCKRDIVMSVTRQSSNRVQFNTGDRDTVLRASEVMTDLLAYMAFRIGDRQGGEQAESTSGDNQQIVAEIVHMKEEMGRMSKALRENETKNELAVLKTQMQDLRNELISVTRVNREVIRRQGEDRERCRKVLNQTRVDTEIILRTVRWKRETGRRVTEEMIR